MNRMFFIALIAVGCIVGSYILFSLIKPWCIAWYLDLPWPKNRIIVERDVLVTMKDGIRLATDVYRPKNRQRYPVLIMRTPYNKKNTEHGYGRIAEIFASQGYVVAVQDVRGKHRSEGIFVPHKNEPQDGYDTVQWAGTATWSDGNVAILGFSYLAYSAWQAAALESPYLKTIVPMFGSRDAYRTWINKGVLYLKDCLFWQSQYLPRHDRIIDHSTIDRSLEGFPVAEADIRAIGEQISLFQEYLQHSAPDYYWKNIGTELPPIEKRIPALCISGWYDRFVQHTIDDWNKLDKTTSRLILGPWQHKPTKTFPEMDWGRKAKFNAIFKQILQWCDHWLKGIVLSNKRVHYFVMGENVWRTASSWPPKEVVYETLFLSKGGMLSKNNTDGEISWSYIYNPKDPTPSLGSHILYGNGLEGPREQSPITDRADVLLFRTAEFDNNVTIAGPPKIVLYISTTAVDTDFVARLSDVHPDRKAYALQSEIIRMRYLDGVENPKLIEPGEIYKVEIVLPSTCHSFQKGHRLQLQITSSDFPNYGVNLNAAKLPEVAIQPIIATQTIYGGENSSSYLLLPILKL